MRDYADLVNALRGFDVGQSCPCEAPDMCNENDCMVYQAADAIEELLARDVVPMDFHERCLLLEVKKRIELEKQLPQWISVEDRLPELNQEVFVYAVGQTDGFFGDSVITKCKRCIFKMFPSSEGFEKWSSPWQYFHTDYTITHWMPLPAPPKGVE